jgi:hypothetical protein
MTMQASAADILQSGVSIEPEEAVAIAQQLIVAIRGGACADLAEPPYGPPTPEQVVLCDDGSVTCRGCDATPAVSEIARLLEALLPPAPARVPGGLRFTIARALLDVDVVPFDSLDELSETLARYERGPREQIVTRLLERFAASRGLVPSAMVERRRHVRATELRRALREADARLYQQRAALQSVTVTPRPQRARSVGAGLAGLAAGALLMVTGQFMYQRGGNATTMAAPTPAAAAAAVAPADTASGPQPVSQLGTYTPVRDDASVDARTRSMRMQPAPSARRAPARGATTAKRPAVSKAKAAVKETTRPTPRVFPEPTPRGADRDGVLDHLRLKWLRDKFTRADL